VTFQLSGDKYLNHVWLQTVRKQAGQQIALANATALLPAVNVSTRAGCCPTGQGVRLRLPGN